MKLVVGLGNPGKKYSATRHNIGFAVVESILSTRGLSLRKESKFEAEIALADQLIFAMPTTFMNNSGRAVQKLMQFYKIASEDILVVHDDVSLDLGKLRFSFDRGAGGQHGVEDIIEKLGGSKKFHRLRIGVGPDPGGEQRADYVLSKFADGEATKVIEKAAQLVVDWLAGKQLDGTQYV